MTAALKDLTVEVAARYELRVTWMTGPEGAQTPKPLTGAKAYLQVRKKVGSPVLIDLTSDGGDIFIEEEPGQIRAVMTPAQTLLLDGVRSAAYDLLVDLDPVTNPGLFVERILKGGVNPDPSITRLPV